MGPWAVTGAAAGLTALGAVVMLGYSGSDGGITAFLATPSGAAPANFKALGSGTTNVAVMLNEAMKRNPDKVYTGGKGVLVRVITDTFEDSDDMQVVPATLWTDDIFAPSQVFPAGDPMRPSVIGKEDPWAYPVVAVVVGSAMYKFFPVFDAIQNDDWGHGVFYAFDSNSVGQRCRFVDEMNFWECPGGSVLADGTWVPDVTKKGAGRYPPWNPLVYGLEGGGGAGCHFDKAKSAIDQINGKVGTDWNLVMDKHCQCNYNFAHNFPQDDGHKDPTTQNGWDGWVGDFVQYGLQGKAGPSWQMDLGACWVNNPRDMINMQNRIYWQRLQWLDNSVPVYAPHEGPVASRRRYWGWNEVPVRRSDFKDPTNWDAVLIVLPAFLCSDQPGHLDIADCLNTAQRTNLQNQLDQHVARHALVPGSDHITQRPGSYVLFARQVMDDTENWRREFFCQDLEIGKYKVVYVPPSDNVPTGICYLDNVA